MSQDTLVLAPPIDKNDHSSSTDGSYRSKLEQYAVKLKIRIKTWEHENKEANLTWDFIKKKHPDMAKRYRKYSKLKKLLKKSDLGEVDLAKLFKSWSRNYREDHLSGLSDRASGDHTLENDGINHNSPHLRHRHYHHHHNHHANDSKKMDSQSSVNVFKDGPNRRRPRFQGVPATPTRKNRLKPISEKKAVLTGNTDISDTNNDENDDDIFVDDAEQTDKIGPTPQLNGRVLGIFDIELKQLKSFSNLLEQTPSKIDNKEITISSPKLLGSVDDKFTGFGENKSLGMFETPTSKGRTKDALFKTPQQDLASCRKKLSFGSNIEQTPQYLHHETEALSMLDYDGMLSDLSDFDESNSDCESSTDGQDSDAPDISDDDVIVGGGNDPNSHILGSADRLDKDSRSLLLPPTPNTNKLIEPSPLIKRHYEKSLFTMNQELKSIKKNLDFFTEQEESSESTLENDADQNEKTGGKSESQKERDPIAGYRKKIKTIKRTTRRTKLKTRGPQDVVDELQGIDIHQKLRELEENARKRHIADLGIGNTDFNNDIDAGVNDNGSDNEEEEEEEGVYVRKMIRDPPNKKRKGRNPLSNNFVRLKINNHRRGRFRGRR